MNLSNESTMEILKMVLLKETTGKSTDHPYEVGKNYHIRTVTMAHAGKLKAVYDKELVLEGASWVADTGRFNEYLKDTSKVSENEPFKNDVIVGRGAIVDCTEIDNVYTKVK